MPGTESSRLKTGPEAESLMRTFLVAIAGLLLAGSPALAKVDITVNKDSQTMTVAVDGVTKYRWPVSTGIPSRETPNGSFKAFRMEADHFSKEFDDAPMPHSIFFTKIGHAIHGTMSEGRLGTPASHGCVRLSRANAPPPPPPPKKRPAPPPIRPPPRPPGGAAAAAPAAAAGSARRRLHLS